ncbi:MAG: hypothetical protein B7Z37_22350 [Verrucomicrobia bacterium 12-59-8]|nr:MAG: hypothetical protein B7Z37_22350 [Verrucomicrobia bacterium 12-59-8]
MSSVSSNPQDQLAELVLDYAWKSLDRATDYFSRTENKASTQGTYIGVTLTIMLAGVTTVFPEGKWSNGFGCAAQILYLCSVVVNAIALLICYRALWFRQTLDIPRVADMQSYIKGMAGHQFTSTALSDQLSDYIAQAQISYTDAAHSKQKDIRLVGLFAVSGVIVLLLAGALSLIHSTLSFYVKAV